MPRCALHRALDLLALVQAQQPGVDEDAGELVADRAMHERRRDRRVDAAGQSADHLRVADELADLLDLARRRTRPASNSASRLADVEQEVRDDLAAARRVRDFGMELHAVDRLATRARIAAIGTLAARRRDDVSRAAARRRDRRGSSTPSCVSFGSKPVEQRLAARRRGSRRGRTRAGRRAIDLAARAGAR